MKLTILETIKRNIYDFVAKNRLQPNILLVPYTEYNEINEELVRCAFYVASGLRVDTVLGLKIIKSFDVQDIKVGYVDFEEEEKK